MSKIVKKIRERNKSKKEKEKSGESQMGRNRKKGKGGSVPALVYDSESETESPWTCKICDNKFFDEDSHVLECERCSDKYCRECLGIKASEYKFLTKRRDVHWFCDECDPIAKKSWAQEKTRANDSHMHDQMCKQLEDMKKDLVQKIESLETKLESKTNERRVVEIVQKHLKNGEVTRRVVSTESLKTCSSQLPEERKAQSGKDTHTNAMFTEPKNYAQAAKVNLPRAETSQNSKKRELRTVIRSDDRERNIIIHRAPESDAENMQARREDDNFFVMTLCDVLEVDDISIERVFRLGPPRADQNRPLKVIFESVDDKADLMSNLYKLRSAEDVFRGLSITNDLTQSEREENKILVQRAKEMTESETSGEFVFRVRGPPWDRHIVKLKKQDM